MNASPEMLASQKVNIIVDGVPVEARRGDMIIEAADAAGIKIPRFCYHKKLSIAANCRMCLIEVEKVPKPLPACATPVTDGMKIYTRSPKALEAQRGVMEFLLINHPLDCPICDQGGECDLQEISMGYGSDHSEFQEVKRVVPDKDIGPLIATEMTRCIHCTRCVRFGEEIAGIRELGATGRGEKTRIGTYIEKAVTSEMSGNVIDLCPVGALTSKPFRFTARAWELSRYPGIAAHDCVGSNITLLTRNQEVMRVDPRENESVNETWISDRDRFSYEALRHPTRVRAPLIKRDGNWLQVDWNTALAFAVEGLRRVRKEQGEDRLAGLISASSTLEEMYLLQKLLRGLGSHNVDHRLQQSDFAGDAVAPAYPWLGQHLVELERVGAALLIGSNIRKDQPLAAHRLRKAALAGAKISFVNSVSCTSNFPVFANVALDPGGMVRYVASIAKALATGPSQYGDLNHLLADVQPDEEHRAIAEQLRGTGKSAVLLGPAAIMHPQYSILTALGRAIAELSGATFGVLSPGANSAGAWIAGAVPHYRADKNAAHAGRNAGQMLREGMAGYLLVNIEPEFEAANPAAALAALSQADFVVAITAFESETLRDYADVILPAALFAETSGTFVNCEGIWQSFSGAVTPPGEARPVWKILRVLGNFFEITGFDYISSDEIRAEVAEGRTDPEVVRGASWQGPDRLPAAAQGNVRVADLPIYAVDPVVRRARALQQTADANIDAVRINQKTADDLGVHAGIQVTLVQGDAQSPAYLQIDAAVADRCVYVPLGGAVAARLGDCFGPIDVRST